MRRPSRHIRSGCAVGLLVALLAGPAPESARAHVGLKHADPAVGSRLGDTPSTVFLSFAEDPEPSLSTIEVLDEDGAAHEAGRPAPVSGDPSSLAIPVRRLPRGVYTVGWRAVSAVDGHATSGSYAFGVGVSPGDAATAMATTENVSGFEILARWLLLAGLVLLIGAAVAAHARFGGSGGSSVKLAGVGWLVSVYGLVLLAEAQRRGADSSLATLLDSDLGGALGGRAAGLGLAGAALLVAWRSPRFRRAGLIGAGAGALGAVAVHVANGHAGAGDWPRAVTIVAQCAHFAAAGVWFGGLAALLVGIRGAPSADKAASVRSFSSAAAVAFVVVAVAGTLRAVDELPAWSDLTGSGYGRTVLAKVALLVILGTLGWRNRRRSVPAAESNLGPMRRTSAAELTLAAGALVAAALLATLAPPAPARATDAPGISISGADPGATVRVRLTALPAEPGRNRFTVDVEDYDSGAAVRARDVGLRFTPLDDPGVEPTSLALAPDVGDSYAGSGDNLAFDGRWRVTASVGVGAREVEVPLEVELHGPEHVVSAMARPGRPTLYTMQLAGAGYLRISARPERAGASRLYVSAYDVFEQETRTKEIVLTTAAGHGPARRHPLRRLGPGRFVAGALLEEGPVTVGVVARTADGVRMRGEFSLAIPGG